MDQYVIIINLYSLLLLFSLNLSRSFPPHHVFPLPSLITLALSFTPPFPHYPCSLFLSLPSLPLLSLSFPSLITPPLSFSFFFFNSDSDITQNSFFECPEEQSGNEVVHVHVLSILTVIILMHRHISSMLPYCHHVCNYVYDVLIHRYKTFCHFFIFNVVIIVIVIIVIIVITVVIVICFIHF